MKIEDKLYGTLEIKENALIDLINSRSINRLKDISQLGMPQEYYHLSGFSRHEHSLGVMILLKNLKASLNEQVAGLLHDASHTPFSHVIDWAIGDPTKEDYQDKNHVSFLINSEIPFILKKHNLDFEIISDYHNFNLLERDSPGLCADRIDYSLREMHSTRGNDLVQLILSNLQVKDNQIVFLDKEIAKTFGEEYMALQREHWGGDEARTRYYLLSEILKKAFKEQLISSMDLKKTETPLLKILNNSEDEFILNNLNLLKKGFNIVQDEEGVELKKKFRYVDPEVSVNGSYSPLTHISKEYFNFLEYEKEKSKEVKKIKIIPI